MSDENIPFVTIILPVRNDEKYIEECLIQLTNQDYPKGKLEILVIDGISQDRTRSIISNYPTHGFSIRLLDNQLGQRAPALNVGIKEAKGSIILRIDSRTRIEPDYITMCVKTLKETGAENVGGVQKPMFSSLKQKALGLALSHPFGVGNAQFRLGKKSGFVDTVYLGCFKKTVFDKVGLFDTKAVVISEDADMNYRIRKAGGKIYLNKDIIARYYPRDNFRDFWKIYFRYGGAKAGNFIKHRVQSWRQYTPPLFILALVTLLFFSLINSLFLKILISMVGLYLLIDITVSSWLAITNKSVRILPLLFIAFPCMHFGWALGFYARLLRSDKSEKPWEG